MFRMPLSGYDDAVHDNSHLIENVGGGGRNRTIGWVGGMVQPGDRATGCMLYASHQVTAY
jgi:hypothetical protein